MAFWYSFTTKAPWGIYIAKTMAAKKTATKEGISMVIETGGKQYRVFEGDTITVEKFGKEVKEGDTVSFDKVLFSDNGKESKFGAPYLDKVTVPATVVAVGKGKKVRVEKFKPKTGYHKVYGHRQPFIKVQIGALK